MPQRLSSLDAYLTDLVGGLCQELPEVSYRRMFGADAFFADVTIFALIHDGRVVLKLPEPKAFTALAALPGAEPWSPIPGAEKPSAHWLMAPEDLHDDVEGLRPWVEQAHRLALAHPKQAAPRKKAAVARKPRRA